MVNGMTTTDHRDVAGKFAVKYAERPTHSLAESAGPTPSEQRRAIVDGLHEPVSDLHAGVLDKREASLRLRAQLPHLSNGAADEHVERIFEAAEYERKIRVAAGSGELSDLETASGESAYDDFRGHSAGWIKDNPEVFEEEWRTHILDDASSGEAMARFDAAQAEMDAKVGHRA